MIPRSRPAIAHLTLSRSTLTLLLASLVTGVTAAQPPAAPSTAGAQNRTSAAEGRIDEIVVWGSLLNRTASSSHPATVITQEDLLAVNVQTTEDIVKFEPGISVRRRFIGDSNGTLGMRGSNMFQTSRSMVFADGVPLHYLLQSRWNGSPRWSMIAASEIARVDVLYGPFSAEYGGNAMGGVILIESAIPQAREVHIDTSLFSQQFSAYGFDDTLRGSRAFFSAGDKVGDLSLYFSVNRLANKSQPQSYYFAAAGSGAATPVTGGITGQDERGREQLWFGDSGSIDTHTLNYKFKASYEIGAWAGLLNIAYEDRKDVTAPNNYLKEASGASYWGGTIQTAGRDGPAFVPASRFGTSAQQRDSLSLGLRVKGPLSDSIELESNLNQFAILRDQTRTMLRNPADAGFTDAAQLTDFGNTGWTTAEVKLRLDTAWEAVTLATGLRHEHYALNTDVFDIDAAGPQRFSARSGGETTVGAAFAQVEWDVNDQWSAVLGGRYERFASDDGYYSQDDPATAPFELINVASQRRAGFSPKLSVSYLPDDLWRFQYAVARAYRFPIVEELFSQYQAYNAINEANPGLHPERGLHHTFTIERQVAQGYIRLNLFHERIDDVIEAQATTLAGGQSLRTFIPLDEVLTTGADLIFNAQSLFDHLDVRFNVTYTDAEIVRNQAQPQLEGKRYPRMPNWRSNLLLTWHFNDSWHAAINYQFADDSYGQLDNSDIRNGVYGAQDSYSRVGLKSSYTFANGFSIGAGVDNLSNDISYVTHPWPGRTFYLDLSWSL